MHTFTICRDYLQESLSLLAALSNKVYLSKLTFQTAALGDPARSSERIRRHDEELEVLLEASEHFSDLKRALLSLIDIVVEFESLRTESLLGVPDPSLIINEDPGSPASETGESLSSEEQSPSPPLSESTLVD